LLAWYKNAPFLLAFALLTATFMACEQSREIGLGIVNQGDAQMFQTDTFAVDAHTVMVDSIQTDRTRSEYLLVGNYQDPLSGQVSASSFVKIVPSVDPVKLPPDTDNPISVTMDSVVFVLGLQKFQNDPINLYPNTPVTQTFYLHRLTEELKDNFVYYSGNSLAYAPVPLATVSVNITTLKENKFLRINLEKYPAAASLVTEIKTMITNQVSADVFKAAFKGFALVPDKNSSTNIIGFADDFSTSLVLHYTATSTPSSGAPNTNKQKAFLLNTGSHFHQMQANRAGTLLAGLITPWTPLSSKLTGGNTFMQAGLGIYTRLEFPTLKNLKKLGNVVINKAELLLKPAVNTIQNFLTPDVLFLYEAGTNGKIAYNTLKQPILVLFDGTSNKYVIFDNRDEKYEVAISRYAQYMMSGDKTNPYIMVAPANANFTTNRVVFGNGAGASAKIRLKVYYTLFK